MTAQIMDTVVYRDLTWSLCKVDWENWNIPSNEELGFECETESTANYSGRVDYICIDRQNRLKLEKIRVNLTRKYKDFVPENGFREELKTIYSHPTEKTREEVFLNYYNLPIKYTGEMILGRQFNRDKYVHMGIQSAESFYHRIYLKLKKVKVLAEHTKEEKGEV